MMLLAPQAKKFPMENVYIPRCNVISDSSGSPFFILAHLFKVFIYDRL